MPKKKVDWKRVARLWREAYKAAIQHSENPDSFKIWMLGCEKHHARALKRDRPIRNGVVHGGGE